MRRRCIRVFGVCLVLLSFFFNSMVSFALSSPNKADGNALQVESRLVPGTYVPGEVLVIYKQGVSTAAKVRTAHSAGAVKSSTVQPKLGIHKFKLPPGLSVEEALAYLKKDPNVLAAGPNSIRRLKSLPDDPLFGAVNDWNMGSLQWGLGKIGFPAVHEAVYDSVYGVPNPNTPVVVAVIDSGVDYNHPDLAGVVLPGYDFADGDNDPMDTTGHGTHVAGIIAAATNNGLGVAGVAGMVYANILPVRIGTDTFSTENLVNAISYAVDNGADIINLSLGAVEFSFIEMVAIAYAQANDILVVGAAGNQDADAINYPGALPGVLTVGASNYLDRRAREDGFWGSNYGPELDVVAPGDFVLSVCTNGLPDCTYEISPVGEPDYRYFSGTSMATPMVSGIAAVIKAVYQDYSAYEIGAAIITSAVDIQTDIAAGQSENLMGWDRFTGRGRVDAYAALITTPPAVVSIAGPSSARVNRSSSVSVTVPVPEMVVYVDVYEDTTDGLPLATIDVDEWLFYNPTSHAHASPTLSVTWTPRSSGNHSLIAVARNLGGLELGRDTATVDVQPSSTGGGGGGSSGGGDIQSGGEDRVEDKIGPKGGSLKAFDGAVEINFEVGAFDKDANFSVKKLAEAAKTGVSSLVPLSPVFQFDTGEAKLQKPVMVTIRYDKEKLRAVDARKLGLYRQDEKDSAKWTYVGGRVDPATGVVQAKLKGFSRYAVMAYSPTFADLESHWARDEAELLAARHVVAGAGDGRFLPDKVITRAEMAKILVEMLAQDPSREVEKITPANSTFSDVIPGTWQFTYIETAAKYDLVFGNEGRFRPDDPVTREEMSALVVRALDLDKTVGLSDGADLAFGDSAEVSEWARGYVSLARKKGLVQGLTPASFAPKDGSTRAQAVTLVFRAMEMAGFLEVPQALEGTLTVNQVEGRHFELEVTTSGKKEVYVLVPVNDEVAEALEANIGKRVRVTGLEHRGASIYMRGPVLRVLSVTAQP